MSRSSDEVGKGGRAFEATDGANRSEPSDAIGAPLLAPFPPRPWTPEGRFSAWLSRREGFVADVLRRLTQRWQPLASFVVVNFLHPELGRSGAIVDLHPTRDLSGKTERLKRASVIPMTELEEYVPRWERGETVLVHVDDMAEPLRRRYSNTWLRWSLNIPVFAGPSWVGLIGASADDAGLGDDAVSSYEAAAAVLTREFDADHCWAAFADGLETVRLVDVWLPHVKEPVFKP